MDEDPIRSAFFEAHPEPMWVYDPGTLRFLAVNDAAIERYGYSREAFLSMTVADLRLPEDAPAPGGDAAAGGREKTRIARHRLASGEVVAAEILARPIVHRGRCAELELARDASRLLELEHRREQGAHLRTAQRLLGIGFWSYNLATGAFSVSDEVHAMYGVAPDGFDGTFEAYAELVHPDDRKTMRGRFEAFAASGEPHFDFEHRIVRPEGDVIHVRGTGELREGAEGRVLTGVIEDVTERRRSEIAVRESEEQLRIAGRAARLGAWRIVLDPLEVIWSDETAAIHGLPPGTQPDLDEAIDYYTPEYRPRIRRLFETCAREGVPYDEIAELVRADGERIWVRAIGEPERGPDGRIVSVRGAFQDVSDLVAARRAARELDLRLLKTLESISDGFFTLAPDWSFVFLNGQAERLLGRSRGELVGRSVWTVFSEAAGPAFAREYRRAVAERRTVKFTEHYAPLGCWLDVAAYPTEEGLAVYLRDVTDQLEAEEAARVSEERFRILAKATNDVIWDWDLVDSRVWWNENFAVMFGYDPTEVEPGPESWSNRIHPEDRDAVLESIHAVIDGTGTAWKSEYRFIHANGSPVTVIDRGYVLRAADGTPLRMIGSMMDVTERREFDARLREAQKLEAVGQLTGGVAHDFNNLLTVILGNAELLVERLGDRPEARSLASMTTEAAVRGAELTSRLLAFARRQALEPRLVDLEELLAGMEGLLRRTLPEEIEIEIELGGSGSLWPVEVDPGQLESALLNLAINARDAMPCGGRLAIGTANTRLDEDGTGRPEDVEPGSYVVVSVSDTGCGMPSDVAARAFDPFFTTKAAGEGSGLGLSMVYGFVKQSGGHARIETRPGEGTCVELYFPRAPEAGAPPEAVASPRAVVGGHEHILVVEDEELVRDHVTRQLRELGYRVSTAGSGPEALERLEEQGPVDLLFTDVVMPGGMDGRQLADAARAKQRGLKVLFTSGYSERAIVHQERVDRDVDLLGKPYRREELAAKLRQVLDAPSRA